MQLIREVAALREARAGLPGRVALVPTMGALHAGHMTLVEEAKRRAEHVVVSIFVNPRQFGPKEDLAAYPRQEAADAALLEAAGVAILWAPGVEAMYPAGYATNVSVAGVSDGLDGAARPGHFDGVATVVAKLFNQVRPDVALFGEKDWQQLAVIRRMAADLDMWLEIVGVPTARDSGGLALSSRNAYLSAEELERAHALPEALREASAGIAAGEPLGSVLARAEGRLRDAGFDAPDYLELRDGTTLELLDSPRTGARLFVAARIGRARLIDNRAIEADRT